MFYSHDLLTNRQYGVATIWLVATLGSKSNLKKVTRKAILDVDIPKACNTITSTDTPLALRLQASLLYGVARVHFQQCNYVLTDTQSFRDKMRGIAQVMKELELDPDVGRTRPEQLNLPDDPAFLPDLDFTFDLSAFDLPSDSSSSRASSVLSSRNVLSSQTSAHDLEEEEEEAGLQLDLPPLDTPSGFGGMSIGVGTSAGRESALHSVQEESHIIDEADFEIAADGSLVAVSRPQTERVPSVTGEAGPISESGFSTRVRDEHAAGMAGDQGFQQPYDDDGMMMMGDDDELRLPSAEPFPRGDQPDEQQIDQPGAQDSPINAPPQSNSTETAEASERRARPGKRIHMDQETGLQNRHLVDWNTNYLENMLKMSQTKQQKRAATQGKKNAAFWILGQGIGGVQATFGEDREPHPLAIFSGQALLDALTGPNEQRSPPGSKRARSPSSDDEDERRVRARTAEGEEGRGLMDDGQLAIHDDDGIMMQGDDLNLESEIGRPAGSSIPDVASILPWNRSASRQGSAQPFPSAGFGISSSVGGPGSGMKFGPGHILGGMRSRLPSSSPLVGKGHPIMDLDDLQELAGRGIGLDDDAGIMAMDDFEQYGPSAAVDTQTAAQSQWMRATLENEAQNFLGFIEAQLVEQGEGGVPADMVTLDELLPPEENSGIVAAQALLHVLALTTKGLLEVEQEDAFGDILLKVVRIGNQAYGPGGRVGESSSPEQEEVLHGSQLADNNDDEDEEQEDEEDDEL